MQNILLAFKGPAYVTGKHGLLLQPAVHEAEPEAGPHCLPRQAGAPRSQVRHKDVLLQEELFITTLHKKLMYSTYSMYSMYNAKEDSRLMLIYWYVFCQGEKFFLYT